MRLDQAAKMLGVGKWLNRHPWLKNLLGYLYYGVLRPPYFSTAVRVNLGGAGPLLLDYRFGHYGYEHFGDRHNSGFHAWLTLCEGKHTVIDAGAHIGLYSLPAASRLAPGGKIFAFEPSTANLNVMRRHCRYNQIQSIELVPCLLGEENSAQAVFYEDPSPAAMGSILQRDPSRYSAVTKTQITLDQFCRDRQLHPQVIKIDVEGAEFQLLRGAQQVLREDRPTLVLSLHPRQIALLHHSLAELLDLLCSLHYRLLTTEGHPVSEPGFGEYLGVPS